MPATRDQLHRVGFSPRQSAVLEDLGAQTLDTLIAAGFSKTKAVALLDHRGTVPDLIRFGKFPKHQAQLIVAL